MVFRRGRQAETQGEVIAPRGFDDFELRLGDLMRGERATLGKSLLDVERDIRIRAAYIAAIENADPEAFDTPGFIPGYVRCYARYLGMDPDETFAKFCAESGFSVQHGMSAGASRSRETARVRSEARLGRAAMRDPLVSPATPFLPERESIFSGIEPGALGSLLVLVVLIAGIGYGGWSVLNEIQRVQFAPAENSPDVLTDLDPLDAAVIAGSGAEADDDPAVMAASMVQEDGLDRIYRPEALDVPVMVARDAPISTIDPAEMGTYAADVPPTADRDAIETAVASAVGAGEPASEAQPGGPKVMADPRPGLRLVAVRPAWIRVRGADGSVIFEGILNGGDTYDVPQTEEPPTLRVGESGAVYFEVAGKHYGPVGPRGSVTKNLALSAEALTRRYDVADLAHDGDLATYVAELQPRAEGN